MMESIDPTQEALDDILEAAGIPKEHATHVLKQRDTYNIVGPISDYAKTDLKLTKIQFKSIDIHAGSIPSEPPRPGGSIAELIKMYLKAGGDPHKYGYNAAVDEDGNVTYFHQNESENS